MLKSYSQIIVLECNGIRGSTKSMLGLCNLRTKIKFQLRIGYAFKYLLNDVVIQTYQNSIKNFNNRKNICLINLRTYLIYSCITWLAWLRYSKNVQYHQDI